MELIKLITIKGFILYLKFHSPKNYCAGQGKRRRKVSRTGERVPGVLLVRNQYRYSFECFFLIGHKKYFCVQSEASMWCTAFLLFLYEGVYLQTRLFAACTCLAEKYSVKMGTTNRTLAKPSKTKGKISV